MDEQSPTGGRPWEAEDPREGAPAPGKRAPAEGERTQGGAPTEGERTQAAAPAEGRRPGCGPVQGAPKLGAVARRAVARLGASQALDGPAATLQAAVCRAVDRPAVAGMVEGAWLGHAVHPLLTDFTNGPWMAASFLDLFGPEGAEPAARRLVGLGLAAAVPTLVTGLADWRQTQEAARRVGFAHVVTSTLATLLYAGSYLARRRAARRSAVALGLLGGVVAFGDGYLGGDLTLVARVGTGRRPAGR